MGDRYFITVTCPKCGHTEDNVYYAPTCDITEYKCPCGCIVNLEELTGISYNDASNLAEIQKLCDNVAAKYEKDMEPRESNNDTSQSNSVEPEDTKEYQEGRKVFLAGGASSSNPYPSLRGLNNMRYRWFMGWYWEKIKRLVEE